jgi:hypothetical protein
MRASHLAPIDMAATEKCTERVVNVVCACSAPPGARHTFWVVSWCQMYLVRAAYFSPIFHATVTVALVKPILQVMV